MCPRAQVEKYSLSRRGNVSSFVTRGKEEGTNVDTGEFAGVGGRKLREFSSVCSLKWEARLFAEHGEKVVERVKKQPLWRTVERADEGNKEGGQAAIDSSSCWNKCITVSICSDV